MIGDNCWWNANQSIGTTRLSQNEKSKEQRERSMLPVGKQTQGSGASSWE